MRKDVRLTYRAVGSSTGQREFSQAGLPDNSDYSSGLTDFGSGDIPMSSSGLAGRSMLGWKNLRLQGSSSICQRLGKRSARSHVALVGHI